MLLLLWSDAIHLGYSRDSFHFHRPTPEQDAGPTPLNASGESRLDDEKVLWRTPFIGQHELPGEEGWTYGNVQSVAGGFMVVGEVEEAEKLRFFFSARSTGAPIDKNSSTNILNCTT